jgi:hypothetical protein
MLAAFRVEVDSARGAEGHRVLETNSGELSSGMVREWLLTLREQVRPNWVHRSGSGLLPVL